MTDIFLSYSRKDKEPAQQIANALEALGHHIWWDEHLIPGEAFRAAIRQKLDEVDCVLVLWSRHSVESEWVQAEAGLAHDRGMLIPAKLEDVEPPMPFGGLQTADLQDWGGDIDDREFQRLLGALGRHSDSTIQDLEYPELDLSSPDDEEVQVTPTWKRWFAEHKKLSVGAALGLLFSGFLLVGEVTGALLNLEQVWKRWNTVQELELSYTPEGKVYANSRLNLRYQAPLHGYISLWNQESPDSAVVRLIPDPATEVGSSQPLSKAFYHETVQIKPTHSNGMERYILLWTPDNQLEYLTQHRYLNREAFEQVVEPLQNEVGLISKTLDIPVFAAQ